MSLNRFIEAQENSYSTALDEIRAGRKRSHWMWFIFPQIHGLGLSSMAQRYAITSRKEAQDYIRHPVLGKRLIEISSALLSHHTSATQIMGSPDDLKLRSCMTLFAEAAQDEPVFQQVLDRFYQGKKDPKTLQILD